MEKISCTARMSNKEVLSLVHKNVLWSTSSSNAKLTGKIDLRLRFSSMTLSALKVTILLIILLIFFLTLGTPFPREP